MSKTRLMPVWEFDTRIEVAKTIIKSAIKNNDFRGLNNLIVFSLFREASLENYQQLYISKAAIEKLGDQKDTFIEKMKSPRPRIHPYFKSLLGKLGMTKNEFVFEHSVDVKTMRLYLVDCFKKGLDFKAEYIKLGLTCPICIITKDEDKVIKSCGRNNLDDVWQEYRSVGIEVEKIRDVCGPLLEYV